jgi:DNA-binding response OmpR family regulator
VTIKRSKNCPTVLILEDDLESLDEIKETLDNGGFQTLSAVNLEELEIIKKGNIIDLFLIDLNLPDGNGLSIVREIRVESEVGIIIVSGKTSEIDRVVGLEIGADDYITKPFSPRELLARVQSVLRRTRDKTLPKKEVDGDYEFAEFLDWKLDFGSHHLIAKSGKIIELTGTEFDLMKIFVESPKRVLSRDFLLGKLHGIDWVGYDRGIDGIVSRLRVKTKQDNQSVPLIKTLRGVGYMFTASIKKQI